MAVSDSEDSLQEEPVTTPFSVQESVPMAPPVCSEEPAPAATLRYHVLRPHAQGGIGKVYIAHDTELQRAVALKEIQPQFAHDAGSQARFIQEAYVTGQLEHPGIVPVYGLGAYPDGRPFYAMRFIQGESFKDAIVRFHLADTPGRDPGERALELRSLLRRFVDVCNALAYAHNQGVLHRDLKPSNIMLGAFGETLVVDWGLAKRLKPTNAAGTRKDDPDPLAPSSPINLPPSSSGCETLDGTMLGTPQYMSPEQAAGRLDQLGPASDIYSLGATLFGLLTGRQPFPDTDLDSTFDKVQKGDFPAPRALKDTIPPALEAICLKAMALRPGDRYLQASDLAQDVERWLADEPVAAWQEPWRMRAGRWVKRHRLLVGSVFWSMLVACLCLVVFSSLLFQAYDQERLARKEKQFALERERKAKSLAEENYQMAHVAVEDLLTRVSENVLLNSPGLETLRGELLQRTVKYYETFTKQETADPRLRADLTAAYFRLAQIRLGQKNYSVGLDDLRKGLKLAEELIHSQATSTELAGLEIGLYKGRARTTIDDIEAPRPAAERFVYVPIILSLSEQFRTLWTELVTRFPEAPGFKNDLAGIHNVLGIMLRYSQRWDEARAAHERAIQLWTALLQVDPSNADYRSDLAVGYGNLAEVYYDQRLYEDSLKMRLASRDVQEKLIGDLLQTKNHKNTATFRNDLAGTYYLIGRAQAALGRVDDALASYRRATTAFTELALEYPLVLGYAVDLAAVWTRMGRLQRRQGQVNSAVEAFEQAANWRLRVVHNQLGAKSSQNQLDEVRFELACALAEAGRTSEKQAARAVAQLRELCTADRSKAANYLKQTAKLPEWAPLRSRADYQEVAQEALKR